MTPDNELISEFRRLTERKPENILRKAQILIELSQEASSNSAYFVNTIMKSWEFSLSYLFDLFENIINREDIRYCRRLIEYFNRQKEFEKTMWGWTDDPQSYEYNRDCRERFGHLKYDFERSELFNKCKTIIAEEEKIQENRKQERKQWEETIVETIKFPRGTKKESGMQNNWDTVVALEVTNLLLENWVQKRSVWLNTEREGLFNHTVYIASVEVGSHKGGYRRGKRFKFKKEGPAKQFVEHLKSLLSNFKAFETDI